MWSGTSGPYRRMRPISDDVSGFAITWHENTSPVTLNRSLPRKGNPGRLASTNILKLGCTGITPRSAKAHAAVAAALPPLAVPAAVAGTAGLCTRTRPSDRRMKPSSTSPLRMQTTSSGALSASSTTSVRPYCTARTSGESAHDTTPPCRTGTDVSD